MRQTSNRIPDFESKIQTNEIQNEYEISVRIGESIYFSLHCNMIEGN